MNSGKLVALHTEDKGKSAFSRFVLPFRWEWIQDGGKSRGYYWKPPDLKKQNLIGRKKYFTQETGKVLYKRAQWLELEGFEQSPWQQGQVIWPSSRNDAIKARIGTPRMVLFEWKGRKKQDGKILRSGFLLLDVFLEPGKRFPTLDDLLNFNEYFRYITRPYVEHHDDFLSLFNEASDSFLREECEFRKDWQQHYFKRWAELLQLPVLDEDGSYYRIVSDSMIEDTYSYFSQDDYPDTGFLVHADDRAYVWTVASLEKGITGLQTLARIGSTDAHDYGHWIKLLNVDFAESSPIKTHHSARQFERNWAKQRTYGRWEEWGTWYGFSYHSGAALMEFPRESPNTVEHFSQHYFDIALLLFYLRVTLFRFSNRLGELSEDLGNEQKAHKRFGIIREQFACFTIRYQFPILSNQQQGIEMYEKARKYFDLDDLYKEVKAEVHETHEFLEMSDSKKLSKAALLIGKWGIPLAGSALVAGVLGININEFYFTDFFSCLVAENPVCNDVNWEAVFLFGIVFFSWVLGFVVVKRKLEKEERL